MKLPQPDAEDREAVSKLLAMIPPARKNTGPPLFVGAVFYPGLKTEDFVTAVLLVIAGARHREREAAVSRVVGRTVLGGEQGTKVLRAIMDTPEPTGK